MANMGSGNLWNYLTKLHGKEYNNTIKQYGWDYKTTTELNDVSMHSAHNAIRQELPLFTSATFLEYLVHFIAADDQARLADFFFSHTHKLTVNSCCQMPRVPGIIHGPLGIPW